MKLRILGYVFTVVVFSSTSYAQVESTEEKKIEAKKTDSVDGLANEILKKMQELPFILATVKDKSSADLASKKIGLLSDEFELLAGRLSKLKEPNEAKKVEISKRFKKGMKVSSEQMEGVMLALTQKPELIEKIGVSMTQFGTKLEKSGKVFERYFEAKGEGTSPE